MVEVRNSKAILGLHDIATAIWSHHLDLAYSDPIPRKTPVVVTYSFAKGGMLDDYFAAPGASFTKFTKAQQANFKKALKVYEAATAVKFVEVDGVGMINAAAGHDTGQRGYANYPTTNWPLGYFGQLMIDGDTDFAPGTRDFRLMLHEIGHAMGLSHSADGTFTLAGDLDNLKNTVMTYNLPGGASITTKLGKLDHKALAYLYGDASGTKGWNVSTKGDAVKIVASNRGETVLAVTQDSLIYGRKGKDYIVGRDGDDKIFGGKGNDKIEGFGGKDILIGNGGRDKLTGHDGADVLKGGGGRDVLKGMDGKDKLFGGSGRDKLFGGEGSDNIKGGGGHDVLIGDFGNDKLFGGSGNDRIKAGDGNNTVSGGAGADVFVFEANTYATTRISDFATGADLIDLSDFDTNFGALTLGGDANKAIITGLLGVEITLSGVDVNSLTDDNFIF